MCLGSKPIPRAVELDPIWHPSPNFGPRRHGGRPDLIVLHYTVMTPAEAALERLCDPAHEVSAHYVIGEDGTIWHLVGDADRAWHAGAGAWRGRGDVNSASLGIELVNDGQSPFSGPQMKSLSICLRALQTRWNIPPEAVIGHSDMAPDRKKDPGRHFMWDRLAAAGLALGPMSLKADTLVAEGPDLAGRFQEALGQAGYPTAPHDLLLDAFRSRFAPTRDGDVNAQDVADAIALARLLSVDRRGQTA